MSFGTLITSKVNIRSFQYFRLDEYETKYIYIYVVLIYSKMSLIFMLLKLCIDSLQSVPQKKIAYNPLSICLKKKKWEGPTIHVAYRRPYRRFDSNWTYKLHL